MLIIRRRGWSASARTRVALALLAVSVALACSRESATSSAAQKRVEFSILEDYDKGENLAEVGRDFALFRELGVSTWRGSFGWDDYEPSPGRYEFDWLHQFADLAASHGITLRPYLGYTPAWASAGGTDGDVWNDPPNDVNAWYTFVRTLAANMRRHRNIVSYEIYNEENVRQWWDGSPQMYRQVLVRGAEAVEHGNPNAQVLLGGMVFPDREWIETVCDGTSADHSMDVIPFHAYPETWTPPDVTVETYLGATFDAEFVRPADAACGRKPLWINETGYATTPGRTEADQAQWWVRAVATFAANPRIEHIGIYEIKDLPADRAAIGDAPNYHLGLTRNNRARKLAFGTVARLVSLLGTQPVSWSEPSITPADRTSPKDVFRHLFHRADGRQVLFLWTRGSDAVVDVRLARSVAAGTEYALDGTPMRQVVTVNGRLVGLELKSGEVRFFDFPSASKP